MESLMLLFVWLLLLNIMPLRIIQIMYIAIYCSFICCIVFCFIKHCTTYLFIHSRILLSVCSGITLILVSIFSMFNVRIIFYIYWTIVYHFIVDLWVLQNLDISVSWVNVLEICSPIPCLASLLINDIFWWIEVFILM